MPAVLVGDARLGGISATLAAADFLLARGYDVDAVLLIGGQQVRVGGMWGRVWAASAPCVGPLPRGCLGWAGW